MSPPNNWPTEQIDELLRLSLLRDLSASAIANEMGTTFGVPRSRSAIVGKIFRLKHAGREVGAHWCKNPTASRAPRPQGPPKPRPRHWRKAAPEQRSPLPLPPVRKHKKGKTAVDFIERHDGQCAYPLWGHEARIGKVCGADVDTTSAFQFCVEHGTVCFRQ